MDAKSIDDFARGLDWNLLRTFVVVAQEKSITRAAERLALQQPAVSMALKRLESTLEAKLIDRSPGRFELTSAGEQVLAHANLIYGVIGKIPELNASDTDDLNGHVAVFAVSQVIDQRWDLFLQHFFAAHPKVTISVTVGTTQEVLDAVERGTATMGIVDGVIPPQYQRRLMQREEHAVFCGRGHPLYGRSDLELEQLRGHAFVGFVSDQLGGEHMNSATALRALSSIGQFVRGGSAHVHEVKRLIESNVGFGILPIKHVEQELLAGSLWRLPPYENAPLLDVYLVSNSAAQLSATESAMLAEVDRVWAPDGESNKTGEAR